MAKVDRLLNIVAALQASTVPLTADELRARVPGYEDQSDDTFRRTFERDKDDLRSAGVPVETVVVEHLEQPKAGYRIRRDRYELPDPGLTPEELASLHLAATSVRLEGIPYDEVDDALRKLGGVTGSEPAESAPLSAVAAPAALSTLFEAVLDHRQVRFAYGSEERHLEPHRLQYEQGRWYVSGHDVDRDATRSFRLDRIAGPVETGEPGAFEPPADLPGVRLRPWELGDGPATTAHVLLEETVAGPVLAEDPDLVVAERRDDGSVVVELQVRSAAGLRSFVLSHLERAELLDPPALREDLVGWLQAFVGDAA
ncbi:helix-turn-helix transcriptional regulator [Dermatobacter hominis]|uniref:helix-turn-helix transcriptional regulator n=1 Tax=Dermatobacter hominis TaxID=2884263 RepID=UPI001D0F682F|nr:WYL domain-containing protein [Dermatobacter hominis]UDY36387.1 WYL domain-containing protein [Dermatobacter hominis]